MINDSAVKRMSLFGLDEATLRRLAVRGALALAFGVGLALLEPFGLGEGQVLFRLGFWTAMMAVWFVLFSAIDLAAGRVAWVTRLHPASRVLLIAALAAGPMVVISQSATDEGFVATDLLEIIEGLGQVLLIAGAFEGLTAMIFAHWFSPAAPDRPASEARAETTEMPGESAGLPPLVRRLPFAVRGPVICLQMEDHYVRVHTTRGSALVLMRLSDAVAELEPAAGLRVHRSWWIAIDALQGIDRSPRSVRAHLSNGIVAPVSQPYVQALFDATND